MWFRVTQWASGRAPSGTSNLGLPGTTPPTPVLNTWAMSWVRAFQCYSLCLTLFQRLLSGAFPHQRECLGHRKTVNVTGAGVRVGSWRVILHVSLRSQQTLSHTDQGWVFPEEGQMVTNRPGPRQHLETGELLSNSRYHRPQVPYIFSNLLSGNVLINTNMCNALANPSTFRLTVGTGPKPQNWISNGGFLYVSDKSGEDTLPYSCHPQYLIGGFLISLWAYQSNFWKAFSKRWTEKFFVTNSPLLRKFKWIKYPIPLHPLSMLVITMLLYNVKISK